MESTTVILIIISFVTALFIALFQYVYKEKSVGTRQWILAALRTVSLFAVFLLLINPKFERVFLVEEKPNLVVAIDNSSSMSHLDIEEDASNILEILKNNKELNSKFNIDYYKFGKDFEQLDSLSFDDGRTDFSKVLETYAEVYKDQSSPLILVSDGNQTYGSDVTYSSSDSNNPIFPIILGDTTSFNDLRISKVNHNRYVFHKNKFEVEIILNYKGSDPVYTKLQIYNGNSVVYSRNLEFNGDNSSEILTALLTANSIGVQNYRVELAPLENERNTNNNSKEFAVEVIDQKTTVAIVYSTPHPDIGALKKSITTNDQREVILLKPAEYLERPEDFQLVVLYQPDNTFRYVLQRVFDTSINTLVITGKNTDWELLNSVQGFYNQEITYQEEDYQPVLNPAYSPFILSDLSFDDYPPLASEFGSISFNTAVNVAIYKSLNGNQTSFPQLTTLEINEEKHGLLLGEGIWRWRSQSYLNSGSFEDFDVFIGKLIQYLSSNKRRKRLVIDYESFYNSNDEIVIAAQFFNKSYELDNTAGLLINLKNIETEETFSYPLLYSESGYKVDLSGMESGSYEFTVVNSEERISQTGTFKVIAFNIEQQFLRPDVTLLQSLATNSGGALFDYNSYNALVDGLIQDENYVTIQKETREVSPLIDWYYLLVLIALAVSLEWFIRKYNGLI